MHIDIRDRRLMTDYTALREFEGKLNLNKKRIAIEVINGSPPSTYGILFYCTGYIDLDGNTRNKHHVRLELPLDYPLAEPPRFFVTDKPGVISPHIWDTGLVCLGFKKANPWKPFYRIEDIAQQVRDIIRFEPRRINLGDAVPSISVANWRHFMENYPVPADEDSISV